MGSYENKLGNFIPYVNKDSSVPFVLNNNESIDARKSKLE